MICSICGDNPCTTPSACRAVAEMEAQDPREPFEEQPALPEEEEYEEEYEYDFLVDEEGYVSYEKDEDEL